MKSREFGAWPPWNVRPGGRTNSGDEYNSYFKKERAKAAPEYASRTYQEYHTQSEQKDTQTQQPQQPKLWDSHSSKTDKLKKRSKVLRQVVGLVVGSVIIVTTYQTQVEARTQERKASVVPEGAAVSWNWDTDDGVPSMSFFDEDGNEHSLPAQLSETEQPASCTEDGLRTSTATVIDGSGAEFRDTQTQLLPATGHQFPEEGEETEPGTVRYRCTACGEALEISYDVVEEE